MMLRKTVYVICALVISVAISIPSFSQTQTTFKSGSAIIDMGSSSPTVKNSLKPYGLIYALLKNNYTPVSYVVNTTKVQDGIDFIYNGKSYKGGTFIISADHITSAVTTVLNSWSNQGVIIDYTNSDLTVGVNYKINFVPKWVMDKTNGSIGVGFLTSAGIPSSAYSFKTPDQLGDCDDIFVLPHADPTWATHSNLLTWNGSPKKGIIWAGCHAVSVLENLVNPGNAAEKMNFLTSGGLVPFTDHNITKTPFSQLLPGDLVAQFIGKTDNAQTGGSETVYLPKPGSNWNAGAKILTTSPSQADVPSLSAGPAVENIYGRGFDDPARGYVMYQASHNIGGTGTDQIAAQRIFFNFSLMALNDKVPPIVSIAVSGLPSEIKAGNATGTLTATATGTGTGFTYQWYSNVTGTFSNATGSTTTFTPSNTINSSTKCIITCVVTESCGRSSFDVQTMTVLPPTPPIAAATITKNIPDGCTAGSVSFNVFDSNVDANAGTRTLLSVTGLANGTVVTTTSGDVTFTATANYKGTTTGTYTITNGTSNATGNISITVGTSTLAPALTDDNASVLNNTLSVINVLANDKNNASASDGGQLYIRDISTKPAKGYVYINANGTLTYLSKDGQTGSDSFQYLACNTSGYCSSGTVSITLVDNCGSGKYQTNQLLTPLTATLTATADATMDAVSTTTNFGSIEPITIRSNSGGNFMRSLITFGGLATTFSSTDKISSASLILTASSSYTHPSLSSNNTSLFPLTVSALRRSWDESTATWNTTDGTTTWGTSGAANTTSDITTTGQTTFPFSASTTVPVDGTVTADVSTIVQNWVNGTVINNGVRINPALSKTTTFSYYSRDNATTSKRPQLSVSYYPCQTTLTTYAPVVYPDASTTSSTVSVTISPLANDANYYSNTNNISAVNGIASGTFTTTRASINFTTTQITYTPNGSFVGIDTITYTVKDLTNNQTTTGTIRITVTRVAPTVLGDNATTPSNTAVTINVGANDVDPQNSGTLSAPVIVTNPKNGTVSVVGNNVVYTPSTGFTGTDNFTYKRTGAQDDACTTALSSTATVTVTVTNQAPVANDDSKSTFACTPVSIDLKANDTDPENGQLTVTITQNPANGTVTANADGTYKYTPNTNYVGTDVFKYTVKDPSNATSNTATVTVTISGAANPNTAPSAVADQDNTLINQVVYTNVLQNDSDPENDAVTLSITAAGLKAPSNGTIQLLANNLIKYTPNTGFFGTDTYEYQITDAHPSCSGTSNLSSKALVTITVNPTYTSLAGKVWNDANNSGQADFSSINSVGESGTNGNGSIYIYLVDNTNKILDKAAVASDGTYLLISVPTNTANLKLVLSNDDVTVGSNLSTSSLPVGYVNSSPLTRSLGTTTVADMTGYDWGILTNPVLSAGVIVSPGNLCGTSGTPGTFTATSNASGGNVNATGYSYQWQSSTTSDFSGAVTNIAGATNATYTPSAPITVTTYFRRGASTNLDATVYSNIVSVVLNPVPTVTISPLSATILTGLSQTVTAGGADTYSWTPATGLSASNTASVTATPSATATYTVTGTVTATGCTGTGSITITVINPGTIGGDQNGCGSYTPSVISSTADASGAGGISYQWQSSVTSATTGFTNIAGATGVSYTPPASITATTYYKRTATVNGVSFSSNVITKTVNPVPTVTISPLSATILTGLSQTVTAGGADTYSWTPATGLSASNTATVTATPSATATYTVTGTVTATGCTATGSITITVINPGTIGGDQNSCGSYTPSVISSTADASGAGGISYQWQSSVTSATTGFTDIAGATGTSYTPSASIAVTTYYKRIATVNGANFSSNVITKTVNAVPVVSISPVAPSIVKGASQALTASGANSYVWTPSTGLSATNSAGVTATPSTTTTYTVTGTSLAGCTATANVTVTVTPRPILAVDDDYTGTPINGAKGGTTGIVLTNDKLNNVTADLTLINLSLISNGGITGLVFDTNGALVVPANTTEGTYTVTYSICEKADPGNCSQANVLLKIERGLALTATAVCKNDVPYIQYKVVPNFTAGANPVTLTWLNGDKTVLTAQPVVTGQALEAEILWPGATVDANGNGTDWPGWYIQNGQWTQGSDGFEKTRPDAYLVISVNPTDTIKVSYPPATPACNAAPPAVLIPVDPGTIATSQIICSGTVPAGFTSVKNASGGNGTITYQWQQSTDSLTFTNISGATAGTYSAPAISQKTWFRRAAAVSANGTFYSNIISVTPVAPPAITAIAGPCALQKDSTKTFSVPAASPAATNYVWTLPAGYTGSSATNSISVKAGTTNGVISVQPFNGTCAGNTVNYTVSVIDYAKVTIGGVPVTASGNNNNPVTVTVTLYDANGNKINCSGGPAVIKLCEDNPGTFTTVIDNNDGTYTAKLVAAANTLDICGTVGGVPIVNKTTVTFTGPQGGIKGNGPILATETPKLTFTMTAGRSPFTVIYKSAKSNKTDTLTNYISGTPTGVALIPSTTLYTLVSIIDANGERRDNRFNRDTATIIVLAPKVIITLKSETPKLEKDSSWATIIRVKTKNIGDLDLSNSQARLNLRDVFPNPVTFVLDSVKVFGNTVVPNRVYDGVNSQDLFAKLHTIQKPGISAKLNQDQTGNAMMASPDGSASIDIWNEQSEAENTEAAVYDDGHSIYMFGPLSSLPVGIEADITLWLHVKPNGYTEPFVMQAVALGTGSTEGATALATSISNDNEDVSLHPEVTKQGTPVPTVINLFPSAVVGASLAAGTPVLQGNGTYNVTLSYKLRNYGNVNLTNLQLFQNLARSVSSPSAFTVISPVTVTGNLSANPSFNARTDTNMILPSSVLGYKQEAQLQYTINITPNQLSAIYRLQATATAFSQDLSSTVTDLSNDGSDPDPDGNNIPSEKVITEIIINTPVPPLVPGKIAIRKGSGTVLVDTYCASANAINVIPVSLNSGGVDTYLYQWQSSSDSVNFKDIIGAEDSTYTTGQLNNSGYLRRATISGNQVKYSNFVLIQINPLPAKPQITASGSLTLPVNGSVTLTSSAATGNTWSNSATTRSITVNPGGVGPYAVKVTDANGCSNTSDTAKVLPPPPVTTDSTYIINSISNPLNSGVQVTPYSGTVQVSGPSLKFYTVGTGGVLIPVPVLPLVPGTYTYYVSQTINGIESALVPYKVTMLDPVKVADLHKVLSSPPVLQADGSFLLGFTLYVINLRNELLDTVRVKDDLTKVFPAYAGFQVVDVSASGKLKANALYNGNSQTALLSDVSQLPGKQTDSIKLRLKVIPNGFSGTLNNVAELSARSPYGIFTIQSDDTTQFRNPSGSGQPVRVPTPFTIPLVDIFIPEGFSPNRDGTNDLFVITRPYNVVINLDIYNRWGNLVYKAGDYKNDWDGRGNQSGRMGDDLPDGTYYYIVLATDKNTGSVRKFAGFITLKR